MTGFTYIPLALALLGTTAQAHMGMTYPPPLRSKHNPHTSPGAVDYSMTSPLRADGSDFPCKGYLGLLGTPQGAAVAAWSAGGAYNFTVGGGANHNGGSCQAALSLDGGASFRVVHSYEGGCPGAGQSSYAFVVPGDAPERKGAVFAWTWFNNLGNREMYMNCAVVDIVAGGGGRSGNGVAFESRPGLFVANIGNGCRTVESTDVKFPDPGPEVDSQGGGTSPEGNCETGTPMGGGGGSSSSASTGGSGPGGTSSDTGSGSSYTSSGSSGSGNTGSDIFSGSPGDSQGETSTSAHCTETTSPPESSIPPTPTATPAPSPPPLCVPAPTITITVTATDRAPWKGWTPGNDWPDWFQSHAIRHAVQLSLVAFLWALLFAYLLS